MPGCRRPAKTEQEVKDLTNALKNAVYARKKDFGEIRRLTEDLKSRLERPMAQMGTTLLRRGSPAARKAFYPGVKAGPPPSDAIEVSETPLN